MLYPLTFHPIFKERVWGGRNLQRLYHKPLPPNVPIGESWEISDRPGDVSVVAEGPLAGRDLHWLVTHHSRELLGSRQMANGHFPLLIKILDAQQVLSLQVHPPAAKVAVVGGEPKTEMWYVAEAQPDAVLYAGLKRGTTRGDFEKSLKTGSAANFIHRLKVRQGDAIFLPSGRVHALGAGLVIFEIQQNSDTTFRVFDWNRVGLDGKPRDLHIRESLASIDFQDFEPALLKGEFTGDPPLKVRQLVRDTLFSAEVCEAEAGALVSLPPERLQIIALLAGEANVVHPQYTAKLTPGQFCLVPACVAGAAVMPGKACRWLRIEA